MPTSTRRVRAAPMTAGTVLLVRHAPTPATRTFRFPADEPLDHDGRRLARALAGTLRADRAVASPAVRCRVTAALAGFEDVATDPDLRELDFGAWAGRDLRDVERTAGPALTAWYADPSQATHGGESLDQLSARVRRALARARELSGTTVMFTHAGPIKVAVVQALGAPLSAVWQLDVAPCTVTELRARPTGGWTLACMNACPRPGRPGLRAVCARPGGHSRPSPGCCVPRSDDDTRG